MIVSIDLEKGDTVLLPVPPPGVLHGVTDLVCVLGCLEYLDE
jgi:hypothetical protein